MQDHSAKGTKIQSDCASKGSLYDIAWHVNYCSQNNPKTLEDPTNAITVEVRVSLPGCDDSRPVSGDGTRGCSCIALASRRPPLQAGCRML